MNKTSSQIEHKSKNLGLKKSKELMDELYNVWTPEEIQILKSYFCNTLNKNIQKMIPNRTILSINNKGKRLGLKKNYKSASFSRINLDNNKIIELNDLGMTKKQIAKELNCSEPLIGKRFMELKIKGDPKKDRINLDNKKIKRLYSKGKSQLEIANLMDCSSESINRRLINMNIKIRSGEYNKPKLSESKIKEIIDLYKEGNSTYEIEEKTGVCYERVFNTLKRNGINLRTKNESLQLSWDRDYDKRSKIASKQGIERMQDKNFAKRFYKSMNMKPNKPEKVMIEIIKENNLPFNYVGNGQIIIRGFNPDFLSRNPKHIIEVYGDYWHRNDKKHERRINAYSKYGYKTLVIWEHELVNKRGIRLKDMNPTINKIKEFLA